jgi:transposase
MCDALSRNMATELRTIVANCLAHARRRFVEVIDRFPEECRHVLEALKKAILHRKNALFYKTPRGAHVGDVFKGAKG